jgi:hypothetical protein
MINSSGWLFFATVKLVPTERCPLNTETPNVVYWFLTCVAAEYKKVRFAKYDSVTISSAWCASNNRYNHPLSHSLAVSHIK